MESLFVTGGSGFVGRRLLAALDPGRFRTVHWLSRDPARRVPAPAGMQPVAGDLNDPESYRSLLNGDVTVVHLAAATGRAGPAQQRAANVDGTRVLLGECSRAGVRRFLHVSSIAAKFPEKKHYPYGRAKEEGEALVRAAGLPYTILRPTIIAGPGSPVMAGLRRLAALPVMPVFGGGKTRIQPIHVDDLVRVMLAVLAEDRFQGETLEIGGPQAVSIEDFLLRLRRLSGSGRRRVVRLPLRPLIPLLAAGEKVLGQRLPLSASQLYTFRHDGVAEANPLTDRLAGGLRTMDEMIAEDLSPTEGNGGDPRLERECRVFGRYLLGQEMSPYVRTKYAEGHAALAWDRGPGFFDPLLVAIAARHPLAVKPCDAYARFFRPRGLLRKKLVLLLAILEMTPPYYRSIDAAGPGSLPALSVAVAWRGFTMVLALVPAVIVLLPLQVLSRISSGRRAAEGENV